MKIFIIVFGILHKEVYGFSHFGLFVKDNDIALRFEIYDFFLSIVDQSYASTNYHNLRDWLSMRLILVSLQLSGDNLTWSFASLSSKNCSRLYFSFLVSGLICFGFLVFSIRRLINSAFVKFASSDLSYFIFFVKRQRETFYRARWCIMMSSHGSRRSVIFVLFFPLFCLHW